MVGQARSWPIIASVHYTTTNGLGVITVGQCFLNFTIILNQRICVEDRHIPLQTVLTILVIESILGLLRANNIIRTDQPLEDDTIIR